MSDNEHNLSASEVDYACSVRLAGGSDDDTARFFSGPYSAASIRGSDLRSAICAGVMLLTDLLAVGCAFLSAGLIAEIVNLQFLGREYLPFRSDAVLFSRALEFGSLSMFFLLMLSAKGHYTQRIPFWTEVKHLVHGVTIFALLDAFLQYASKEQFSRLWLVFSWGFLFLLIVGFRFAVRRLLMRAGIWQLRTMLLYHGSDFFSLASALGSERGMGYVVVGGWDLSNGQITSFERSDLSQMLELQLSKLAPALRQVLGAQAVDYVVYSPAESGAGEQARILSDLLRIGVPFSVVPNLHGLAVLELEAQYFYSHDLVMLRCRNNLANRTNKALKRIFDLSVASVGLLLVFPLMLLLAGMVSMDGGPVTYRQSRIGRDGRHFGCIKFRSMCVDADQKLVHILERDAGARAEWVSEQKLKDDPRVTWIGRFLRKTSLDELPQLINVIRGEMSLVGPRPIVDEEIAKYGDVFDLYQQVRPGITGLWQVSGRNDTGYEQRVALDNWYVRNWSLWQDVTILLRTIPVVLGRKGSY